MDVLSLIVVVVIIFKVGPLVRALYKNWTIAKQLKVPIILSPLTPKTAFWKYLQALLPSSLPSYVEKFIPFVRLVRDNWMFDEKHAICAEYGEVFALVSPGGIELFIGDAELARQVLNRGRDFPKQIELMGKMNVFGKSLATVEGSDWKRHQRLTLSAFSDNVHENVWKSACDMGLQTLKILSKEESSAITKQEMDHLSFKVLMKACMGFEKHSKGDEQDGTNEPNIDAGQRSLKAILQFISCRRPPRPFALPALNMSWFSSRTQRKQISQPKSNPFQNHLKELSSFFATLIAHRKTHPQPGYNLLSSIVNSSKTEPVSDDEIKGNLFLLMFAGHETTANTLLYAIYLLAIYPKWQTWATEELDQIFSGVAQCTTPRMQEVFPRLVRLKAIMYETLRLYGPVVNLLRKTVPEKAQLIKMADTSDLFIPGSVKINVLTMALHTNPKYWGADALEWNPSRWIIGPEGHEEIDQEKVSNLFAWAEGPRACPGKRFSQLEIVAVLLTILKQSRVELSPRPGVSIEQTRIEALHVLEESRVRLTLQMENPDLVRLRWIAR